MARPTPRVKTRSCSQFKRNGYTVIRCKLRYRRVHRSCRCHVKNIVTVRRDLLTNCRRICRNLLGKDVTEARENDNFIVFSFCCFDVVAATTLGTEVVLCMCCGQRSTSQNHVQISTVFNRSGHWIIVKYARIEFGIKMTSILAVTLKIGQV